MTGFEKADADSNGHIDKAEWDKLAWEDRRRQMNDEDHKRDAQLRMTWFALSGMVLYPLIILTCSILGFDTAAKLITDIASIYIVSVSGLCAAYFGFNAMNKKASAPVPTSKAMDK
tara:strand:- start:236 stop:583 length:348 start_codon:yes stop_codon:yes gene_type:complete